MIESIFDSEINRYVLLYMFLVRSNVFIDLEDDEITKGFEDLYNLNEITVKDLVLVFSGEIIEPLMAEVQAEIEKQGALESR